VRVSLPIGPEGACAAVQECQDATQANGRQV
jgi:hypothetical protein